MYARVLEYQVDVDAAEKMRLLLRGSVCIYYWFVKGRASRKRASAPPRTKAEPHRFYETIAGN